MISVFFTQKSATKCNFSHVFRRITSVLTVFTQKFCEFTEYAKLCQNIYCCQYMSLMGAAFFRAKFRYMFFFIRKHFYKEPPGSRFCAYNQKHFYGTFLRNTLTDSLTHRETHRQKGVLTELLSCS